MKIPHASHDLGARLRRLPGRICCLTAHRRLWKVSRFVGVIHGRAWVQYKHGQDLLYLSGELSRLTCTSSQPVACHEP
jgi:hypothetical protein